MFFNNNTETEYTSFDTYICLLFHINNAFDIKALVLPWHQFVYTLFIPCGHQQHSSGLHHLRSVYQQGAPSFLKTGKSPTGPGPAAQRMIEDVPMELLTQHGLCLPGGMWTCIVMQQNNSLPLRQDNLRSHQPAEN